MTEVAAPRGIKSGLMTPVEAAEYLGIKEKTLRSYANMGDIGYVRVGKYLKFTQKHLDDFIKSNSHPPIRATRRRRETR